MSADTVIQWAHDSVNFWWGCTKVSRGCKYCYAASLAARLSKGQATWGPTGKRWLRAHVALGELLRLERRAIRRGERRRVFINSMADTFEDHPELATVRSILFTAAPCVPHLDLLLLTKRPENVRKMVPAEWLAGKWPANAWLGVSTEDQATADVRVPLLLSLPAPIRFISAEPLVGALDLSCVAGDESGQIDALRGVVFCDGRNEPAETPRIDWVIAGGESGQSAAPCDLDWLRSLRDQCAAAGTAFFLKQLGKRPVDTIRDGDRVREVVRLSLKDGHGGDMAEWPADLRVRQLPAPSLSRGSQLSTLSSP